MVDVVGFDDKYRYQVTHSRCGFILEYREPEVRQATHTDISGCSERWEYIVCPKCSTSEDIPSYAKVEVTNRKRRK